MERLAGRVILLWGWRRALAAFAAGAFAALGQAPYEFFAACFVSFPVLVWLLDGAVAERGRPLRRLAPAFSVGWWFGFGYFLAGLWWVGIAVLVDGRMAWALPFAVVGLPAFLALFYGFAAAAARPFWSDGIGRIAALAFAFGLAEWLRATMFTGFPWNAIGYAAMPVPLLMQSVKVTGLYGMNALAVFVFSLPALLATGRHLRAGLAAGMALVALDLAYGYARLATAPAPQDRLQVRVVQPSISQSEKWDRTVRDRIFDTYLSLSGSPGEEGAPPPQLFIWPETAFPFLLTDRPDALASLAGLIGDGQTLLAGAVRREGAGRDAGGVRYYNAVVQIGSDGEVVDAVDKVHLVPFGEYVPLGDWLRRIGVEELVETVGPFSPGATRRPIRVADGISALPYICYEIIFPQLIAAAGTGADIMVNVTNDAWFGDSAGPYQHLLQARVRAVEAGVPLVRAANSGISAVVDAYGRIVDALAVDAFGTLDVAVPLTRGDRLSLGVPQTNGLVIVTFFGVIAVLAGALSFRSN